MPARAARPSAPAHFHSNLERCQSRKPSRMPRSGPIKGSSTRATSGAVPAHHVMLIDRRPAGEPDHSLSHRGRVGPGGRTQRQLKASCGRAWIRECSRESRLTRSGGGSANPANSRRVAIPAALSGRSCPSSSRHCRRRRPGVKTKHRLGCPARPVTFRTISADLVDVLEEDPLVEAAMFVLFGSCFRCDILPAHIVGSGQALQNS